MIRKPFGKLPTPSPFQPSDPLPLRTHAANLQRSLLINSQHHATSITQPTSDITMAVKQRSGIAVGLNKGHVCRFLILQSFMMHLRLVGLEACELTDLLDQKTSPRESLRISRTKGHLSKRTAFVREVVKEVSG